MKKIGKTIVVVLFIMFFLTGCGSNAKLKNKEEKIVSFKGGNVTADDLYKELKDKYGIEELIDLMDHQLLDKEFEETEEEKSQIDSQISQIKQSYPEEASFNSVIQQYFGASNEEELRESLSLEFKRNAAVEDYVANKVVSDSEVDEYYKTKTIGKITAKHILIKPDVTDDMSEDEKAEKEEEALEKAKDIIKQLDEGKKFDTLAKKYSDDEGTKEDGGALEAFDNDSDLDENFLDAAAKLEKGKYTSEPVKSQYGYHIIYKVSEEDKPKLSKVKKDIRKKLATQKLDESSTLRYESLKNFRKDKGLKFTDSELEKDYNQYMDNLINSNSSN